MVKWLYREGGGKLLSKIQILDERTANQIAAGEVVERPASVVKELVENSLDAGARRIVVEVEEGGRRLIRVTDDGSGLSPAEARLALERHATSKIRTVDDLLQVTSLGFRGEALPSIASVSRFELLSREAEALEGVRLFVEGGHLVAEDPAGCAVGTRITVSDLFFNTPARLKYLKSNATELGQISDTLTRLALANPQVAFRFLSGKAEVFATSGSGDLHEVAAAVLGREVAKGLLPVEYTDRSVRIHGLLGKPEVARSNRGHQFFFVNGRSIKNLPARFAFEEAYANLLPRGRYPICIIFLEVEPAQVDVNVHPAKAEVRFERDREIRSALYRAAQAALGSQSLVHGASTPPVATGPVGGGWGLEARPPQTEGPGPVAELPQTQRSQTRVDLPQATGWQPPAQPQTEGWQPPAPADWLPFRAGLSAGGFGQAVAEPAAPFAPAASAVPAEAELLLSLRPLGQIHQSYIVCDGPEGLYLIDQHAAHERVFFEGFLKAAEAGAGAVQPLLFPITLDLTPVQQAAFHEYQALIAEAGFEIAPFGGATVVVHGLPAELQGVKGGAAVVVDFLDRLAAEEVAPGEGPLLQRRRVLAALAACKAAIKAKQRLEPEEIQALLQSMARLEQPTRCPHGRPTVICLGIQELAKRFERV